MSTNYRPLDRVAARDLFDGRLEPFGVREEVTHDTTSPMGWRCLTDGRNFLWVSVDDGRFVYNLKRTGPNAPGKILTAIAEAFNTDVVSEYDPQYWGFATQEEFDAWQEAPSKNHREQFQQQLLNYVRGEPTEGIIPGTIGMHKAEIAKGLVKEHPELLSDESGAKLLDAAEKVYDRNETVHVKLSESDIAFVNMLATHEDDLPQA